MTTLNLSGVHHYYEHYTSDPTAPTIVFIHGWLLSRHYWQPCVKLLYPDYPCLIYDLKGFGDSRLEGSENGRYNLEAYALDLISLLEHLNIDNAWLVGHSLGGSIGLWTAHKCPRRVKGTISMNSGGGIYLKEEFERFREAGKQILQRRPSWLAKIPFIDLVFSRMMAKRPLGSYWGRQRAIDFARADYTAALASLLESTTEEEVHLLPRIVASLTCPAYFLAAENDPIMETKYVEHLASFHPLFNTPDTNVIEIPNCGHFAMLEQTEKVVGTIDKIISRYK